MPSRKVLTGAIRGFLGTFTSRYSGYDGYWLFGCLIHEVPALVFDLRSAPPPGTGVVAAACRRAATAFGEQVRKAGLNQDRIASAMLFVTRGAPRVGNVNDWPREGFAVEVRVEVVADNGRRFEETADLFVVPHPHDRAPRWGSSAWNWDLQRKK